MLAFMCGPNHNCTPSTSTNKIQLSAPDLEALLHDFLDEVLYLFSAESLVAVGWEDFAISRDHGDYCIKGTVKMAEYDEQVHRVGSEVKAVTWSNIKVGQSSPFDCYVILDI